MAAALLESVAANPARRWHSRRVAVAVLAAIVGDPALPNGCGFGNGTQRLLLGDPNTQHPTQTKNYSPRRRTRRLVRRRRANVSADSARYHIRIVQTGHVECGRTERRRRSQHVMQTIAGRQLNHQLAGQTLAVQLNGSCTVACLADDVRSPLPITS